MTLKEMREMAKKASLEKHKNEDVDLSLVNTVGNKGVTHDWEWKPDEQAGFDVAEAEEQKKELMIEREALQRDREKQRRSTGED